MAKKVCIFVDGENLRYSINDLFRKEFSVSEYLPKRARWSDFFDHLVERLSLKETSRFRTYWYVIQSVEFYPYNLPKVTEGDDAIQKLTGILNKHPPYREALSNLKGDARTEKLSVFREEILEKESRFRGRFNGWHKIQDGIAKKHLGVEFRQAGTIQYNTFEAKLGREKAVDVKLATDLIMLREIYDTAVIISGDQDYVPAVQAIKDLGKRVVNVAFERRNGQVLPGGAKKLNQITDYNIAVKYTDASKYLGIAFPTRCGSPT